MVSARYASLEDLAIDLSVLDGYPQDVWPLPAESVASHPAQSSRRALAPLQLGVRSYGIPGKERGWAVCGLGMVGEVWRRGATVAALAVDYGIFDLATPEPVVDLVGGCVQEFQAHPELPRALRAYPAAHALVRVTLVTRSAEGFVSGELVLPARRWDLTAVEALLGVSLSSPAQEPEGHLRAVS